MPLHLIDKGESMKTTLRRVLTAFAATALLTAGSAALAAPAHAEIDSSVLGGVVGVKANGTLAVSLQGQDVLVLPNLLSPIV
ncbi:hypothetical protein GCM10010324_56860 [Streptomyces hiroshimensis]|uniref:Uncharacterized protein n=2 Tax=Streptomyces hiroshimensis TaxID=66424 RepID=A0ABQ2Z232_9ACTN|nr:hypothetical protein GCM10010324_56860 [Streptomyces hiroshimensis]